MAPLGNQCPGLAGLCSPGSLTPTPPLSEHQHTNDRLHSACLPPPPAFMPPPAGLHSLRLSQRKHFFLAECGLRFPEDVKESDFKSINRQEYRSKGEVFFLPFLALSCCPAAGQDSRSRPGGAEKKTSVWCGSGTFCLVRGQAQEVLVSFSKTGWN